MTQAQAKRKKIQHRPPDPSRRMVVPAELGIDPYATPSHNANCGASAAQVSLSNIDRNRSLYEGYCNALDAAAVRPGTKPPPYPRKPVLTGQYKKGVPYYDVVHVPTLEMFCKNDREMPRWPGGPDWNWNQG